MYIPTKTEQETIINYNEGEKEAGVYTHNKKLLAMLAKLAEERPDECRFERGNLNDAVPYADYIIPKKWVKIKPPRIMSEEEKAARVARMKHAE